MCLFIIAILGALIIRVYQLDMIYRLILYLIIFVIGIAGSLLLVMRTPGKK
jgi:hypothetical protein